MVKEYDPNLIVENKIGNYDVEFKKPTEAPFRIYGIKHDGEKYARMPKEIAETVSKGIANSYGSPSGGRVRFMTDSPYIALKINYAIIKHNDVTPSSGSAAFNMYVDGEFGGVFRLPDGFNELEFSGVVEIKRPGKHLITLYMPTHSHIANFYIGFKPGSEISEAPDHKYETPVVFYGSSITQGTGSSRSGMTYPAQVSRILDTNIYNLGFGGLAKGEPNMAKYISGLTMSAFVYDYDYNALTDQLAETHEPFFKIIREKQPDLPIIMVSRPSAFRTGNDDTARRFEIIKATYDNAVAAGDKNVYLVNGLEFFGDLGCECMVDGTHPSDFGYYFMAKRIAEELKPFVK